jgi:hypothetical protein
MGGRDRGFTFGLVIYALKRQTGNERKRHLKLEIRKVGEETVLHVMRLIKIYPREERENEAAFHHCREANRLAVEVKEKDLWSKRLMIIDC